HHRKEKPLLAAVKPVLSSEKIIEYQKLVKSIVIENHLLKYIAEIIINTRNNANLYLGASPRASLAIMTASKALAAMNGRDFVTPDDIKKVAPSVLKHRIILTPEKEMEGLTPEKIIGQILEIIDIPR